MNAIIPVHRVPVATGFLLIVLVSLLSAPCSAQTTTAAATESAAADSIPVLEVKKNGWLATGEVVGLNLLIWSYDRFIREGGTNPGFRIGFDSWKENLQNGFEWDDNNFQTNQYAHPYHGNLYFNTARSNGFGYWGSLPFSLGGSLMWEYMMEVHHPAFNDWIATGIGGAALGESFHRLSTLLWDNTATGGERTWREIGGFVINPIGGVNRLFRGHSSKVHANPEEHYPSAFRTNLEFGARTISESGKVNSDTTRAFLRADMIYGDPFAGDIEKPFDTFEIHLQLNFGDKTTFGLAQIKGLLLATPLNESETSPQLIGAFQHFDYVNNSAYEIGGQSFSGSWLGRFKTSESSTLTAQFHADAVILGASKSDYADFTGRSYSYGPGAGFKAGLQWHLRNRPFLSLGHSSHWIFVVNGDAGTHFLSYTSARLDVGIYKGFGVGGEYAYYHANRNYRDFPDVLQNNPEVRVYASWIAY